MLSSSEDIFIFGPSALHFDANQFEILKHNLHKSSTNKWALSALKSLPLLLDSISRDISHLNESAPALLKLSSALEEHNTPDLTFPLSNSMLFPLVIASHLIEVSAFLQSENPDLQKTDRFPHIDRCAQTSGFCLGSLSAAAVACSSNLDELHQQGLTAIQLATFVGLMSDVGFKNSSSAEFVALSATWAAANRSADIEKLINTIPETHISAYTDENRVTITTLKTSVSAVLTQLKRCGVHATEIGLRGQLHTEANKEMLEYILTFYRSYTALRQFEAPQAVITFRPSGSDPSSTTDHVYEAALRTILIEPAEWYKTCAKLFQEDLERRMVCFGHGKFIPYTLSRDYPNRAIYASEGGPGDSSLTPGFAPGKPDYFNMMDDKVAVIGMSCHFPGGQDLEQYWNTLLLGKSQHREVPLERFEMDTPWRTTKPGQQWYGNFIDDYDAFDHKFFHKSPREAATMDPQHRIALQLAYQAVEQSGYFRDAKRDAHIGCYIGHATVDYEANIHSHPANAYSATGSLKSLLAGKISHYFGWTGPSLVLDTACSSATVAIHLACRAILGGEVDGALAGGINLLAGAEWYHNLAGASFLSPTGQCKPFDAGADGYCRGEGGGFVFLKRLSAAIADGDQVIGVLAGSQVYQNQNHGVITAPNTDSLRDVFRAVMKQAGLDAQDISVVEAHGTGTAVGDPAEYSALRQVLGGSKRSDSLHLTAVKGLVGHLEVASGAASLVKVLLMLQEGLVPPHASFTALHPNLNAEKADRMRISTVTEKWDKPFRAALINNYGASGSNSSMIVTAAPRIGKGVSPTRAISDSCIPFWFTGFDERSLRENGKRLLKFISDNGDSGKDLTLKNLSFQASRQSNRGLPYALVFTANSREQLEAKLAEISNPANPLSDIRKKPQRPVILCFGGQVSTIVGLDRHLYESVAAFRANLDHCNDEIINLGYQSIFPEIFQQSPIQDLVKLHTALFALQYASAKTWMDCGVRPAAIVGHSFGELTGLCISGSLSLKDTVRLIAERARLIRDGWGPEKGAMLAVQGSLAKVQELLGLGAEHLPQMHDVSIACYNGPENFTLAGPAVGIDALEELVGEDEALAARLRLKRLTVTHAFHSDLVEPLRHGLQLLCDRVDFRESNIHMEHASEASRAKPLDRSFAASHLRSPVYFYQAAQRLAERFPSAIWLEAGSNSGVTRLAERGLGSSTASHFQAVSISSNNALAKLGDVTKQLWQEGLDVQFWPHHKLQTADYNLLLLPPYQFEKSRHWLERRPPASPGQITNQKTMEARSRLTTFFKYVDNSEARVRFRVNAGNERFQKMLSGHVIAHTAPVAPGMFQVELALDALTSIRKESKDAVYQPELQGLSYFSPLVAGPESVVWLDAQSRDSNRLVWEWSLLVEDDGPPTCCTTGTISFRDSKDIQVQREFERLSRLSGRKRCRPLLKADGDVEVLQGRNIYRAFESVIDYSSMFRHLKKLVGSQGESAGRVVKNFEADGCLDPILTDCFCQVGGIYVNLMTDGDDSDEKSVYIGDRVERWIRAPALSKIQSTTQVWDVYAVTHKETDDSYISDVFAFDVADDRLMEAILGIRYSKVPVASLRKALSRSASTIRAAPGAPKVIAADPAQHDGHSKSKPTAASQIPPASHAAIVDIAAKTQQLLGSLSSVEESKIRNDSSLVALGIDSLMAMELIREVRLAFGCVLETEQVLQLSDVEALVSCIRSALGSGDTDCLSVTESSEDDAHLSPPRLSCRSSFESLNVSDCTTQNPALPPDAILEAFAATKAATDSFIVKGGMQNYVGKVQPRTTNLCIAYAVEALQRLGCSIRSAKPGERVSRPSHLPRHKRYVDELLALLERDACLITTEGSEIVRTLTACPSRPAGELVQELEADLLQHSPEFQLLRLMGPILHNCLNGRQDPLQVMFGSEESRRILSDVYATAPLYRVWIDQVTVLLQKMLEKAPQNDDERTINILEVGAGTGGTTAAILPMIARLGVRVKYTMSDISPSLTRAAQRHFKQFPFVEYRVVDIESAADHDLVQSQHIILGNACVHATRSLSLSLANLRNMLKPEGILLLLEQTERLPWIDFTFGLLEGWWLFEDGRTHAQATMEHWEAVLGTAGFGHVDWTEGVHPESRMQRIIIAHNTQSRSYRRAPASERYAPRAELTDVDERQAAIDYFSSRYTDGFTPAEAGEGGIAQDGRTCVLVTGATGGLGAHLAAAFAADPEVDKVVCMNRRGAESALARQRAAFDLRGISLSDAESAKLAVIETDAASDLLGLSPDEHLSLAQRVTHVVHNAWPMSLTRPTAGYEAQFRTMRNLIDLASLAAAHRPQGGFRLKFQFVSSIGVMGCYPLLAASCPAAPEEPGTAATALPVGYADGKLICEQILHNTLGRHPERFHAMAVRVGQIAGSRTGGYWNPSEHMGSLVKSAQTLRRLPDLQGTLSWCPVDDVAASLRDILFSSSSTRQQQQQQIYHVENPARQPWRDVIQILAAELGVPRENVTSWREWLRFVDECDAPAAENPARPLMAFFSQEFLRMAGGGLVLDTEKSREVSRTMRDMEPVSAELVREYVRTWRAIGFLKHL